MSSKIVFHKNQVRFKLDQASHLKSWITRIIEKEGFSLNQASVVFCNDPFLLNINNRFLKHKTLTDIITFDLGDGGKEINGELYISTDRVKENSDVLGVKFHTELRRVIIHGFLHLMGYSDKSPSKKAEMTRKEDACLSLWSVPRGTIKKKALKSNKAKKGSKKGF
ncbi:MAG: rRNA maturation RNase YbeY [Bacteroidetes bacterium]|nr:rRNA maturation RNase YbeY [Bacteroidota bacterium]